MKVSVTKSFTFDAAHQLPDHDGKCRSLHGHTWRVDITISGPIIEGGPKNGMVLDFGDLSELWRISFETHLDHKFLNESYNNYPTSERLAVQIFTAIDNWIGISEMKVESVRVWETPTGYAEVTT